MQFDSILIIFPVGWNAKAKKVSKTNWNTATRVPANIPNLSCKNCTKNFIYFKHCSKFYRNLIEKKRKRERKQKNRTDVEVVWRGVNWEINEVSDWMRYSIQNNWLGISRTVINFVQRFSISSDHIYSLRLLDLVAHLRAYYVLRIQTLNMYVRACVLAFHTYIEFEGTKPLKSKSIRLKM